MMPMGNMMYMPNCRCDGELVEGSRWFGDRSANFEHFEIGTAHVCGFFYYPLATSSALLVLVDWVGRE